jgi:hypothetical protein
MFNLGNEALFRKGGRGMVLRLCFKYLKDSPMKKRCSFLPELGPQGYSPGRRSCKSNEYAYTMVNFLSLEIIKQRLDDQLLDKLLWEQCIMGKD